MTVLNASNVAIFYGSGTTGPFTFAFNFFQRSDIVATKTTSDSVVHPLALTTDYTLTGAGTYTGGSLTLVTALAVGETLTIRRVLEYTQETSIRNQSAYFASLHEERFDYLTMLIQQVKEIAELNSVVASPVVASGITHLSADAGGGGITVDLTGLTAAVVTKTDDTTNIVTVLDSSGYTIEHKTQYRDGLQQLDETVFLVLFGTNWVKIG